jgi:hypothetical protein
MYPLAALALRGRTNDPDTIAAIAKSARPKRMNDALNILPPVMGIY